MTMYDESLVTDNLNLARFVAKKYLSNDMEYEDIESIAFIGLVKAAKSFDKSKGYAFSTYAVRCIENEIKYYFRKKSICAESLDEPIQDNLILADTIEDKTDTFEEFAMNEALKCALNELDDREKFVVDMLYVKEPPLTQQEISRMLNINQSQVSRTLKRALNKIREYVTQ